MYAMRLVSRAGVPARMAIRSYSVPIADTYVRIPEAMSPEQLDILLNRAPPSRVPTDDERYVGPFRDCRALVYISRKTFSSNL